MSVDFAPEITTRVDGNSVYAEITYTGEALDAMARELERRVDAELFARLAMHRGFVPADMAGRGECHLINAADDLGSGTQSCMCFNCGYTALDDWWDEFNYCPNCGAKVVDE